MKKETIVQIIIIVILAIGLGILVPLTVNEMTPDYLRKPMNRLPNEEINQEEMQETTADQIDKGVEVEKNDIDLTQYDTNITISKAGEYTVSGKFENSILVNANGNVTLTLDNVDIKSKITSAIANASKNNLTLKLVDNSVNTLEDAGYSEYDGCIYSNGKLTIEGNGTLNVYGKQYEGEGIATKNADIVINSGKINVESNDDGINIGGDGGVITLNGGDIYIKAGGDGIDSNKDLVVNSGSLYTMGSAVGGDSGIDTDGKFEISGGSVIALGSDMLQSPDATSTQRSVCFTVGNKISKGTKVSLKNEKEEEIISFEADEEFRTLIVSNEKVVEGTYTLYQNDKKTEFTATVK